MTGMSLQELRQQIDMFSVDNINWIWKVSVSTFNKLSLSPQHYIDGLVEGTVILDELALFIAARVLNIHIIVLCDGRYWSTRADAPHENCHVKLAFAGGHSFKEITCKKADDFDKSFKEDLHKTGLGNDSDNDSGSYNGCNCEGSCDCSNPSDMPFDDKASNLGDETSVITLSLGNEMDVPPVNLSLVKKEPTCEITDNSIDHVDVSASTSTQAFQNKMD